MAWPSLRSLAKLERAAGHIGSEILQVVTFFILIRSGYYQQSRILVNARKSELANWNLKPS
uniref:Uncharacterized protein n=1 Tax=Phlebia radiata TaxID=5308 RepID=L8B9I5_PHLRA|nr:hypothetical protein Pra_mt0317 [Phlebia radiata]CCF07385.1 hypothetical protein Pra_mt0317 [Phlebia radiata]